MVYSKHCLAHLILVLHIDWPRVTMKEAGTTKALCVVRQTSWRIWLEPRSRVQKLSLLVPWSLILLNQTSITFHQACQVQRKLTNSLNLLLKGTTHVLGYLWAPMNLWWYGGKPYHIVPPASVSPASLFIVQEVLLQSHQPLHVQNIAGSAQHVVVVVHILSTTTCFTTYTTMICKDRQCDVSSTHRKIDIVDDFVQGSRVSSL